MKETVFPRVSLHVLHVSASLLILKHIWQHENTSSMSSSVYAEHLFLPAEHLFMEVI